MAEEPNHTTPPVCDPAQSIQRSKAARNSALASSKLLHCPTFKIRPGPQLGPVKVHHHICGLPEELPARIHPARNPSISATWSWPRNWRKTNLLFVNLLAVRRRAIRHYFLLKPTVPTKLNLQICPLYRRPATAIGGGSRQGRGIQSVLQKRRTYPDAPNPLKFPTISYIFGSTTGL